MKLNDIKVIAVIWAEKQEKDFMTIIDHEKYTKGS